MDEQKIYSAASYCIGVLKRSSTDKNNMIVVDRLVYLSALSDSNISKSELQAAFSLVLGNGLLTLT